MLRKIIFGAAASLSAMVMLPGAAQADHRDGYYSRYDDGYYRERPRRYRPGDYYRGHRRGGNGTTGAILGGAIGALDGREIGRSC